MDTKFVIGMAVYDDFNGVFSTTQDLLTHHGHRVKRMIVVDNAPETVQGDRVKRYCEGALRSLGTTYVSMPEPRGTAPPRDRVFQEVPDENDIVVVMDSHLTLEPGALDALAEYYNQFPDSPNLVQGPLVVDDHRGVLTHFNDKWGEGSGMWGQWETDETLFPKGMVDHRQWPVATKPWGEIPAQGLGLFACRKKFWPGFHPKFREFGGEEWYIHEKFRKLGRKVICVTGLRWVHRFADAHPGGVPQPYSHSMKGRCRNYVIGFTELGLNLKPVYDHFVPTGHVTDVEWNEYLKEAGAGSGSTTIKPPQPGSGGGCGCQTPTGINPGQPVITPAPAGMSGVDAWVYGIKKHLPETGPTLDKLTELARGADTVVHAYGTINTTAAALAVGRPKTLRVVEPADARTAETLGLVCKGQGQGHTAVDIVREVDAEPVKCDVLYAGPLSTPDRLTVLLARWVPAVEKLIVVDGGDDQDRRNALRAVFRDHPEWILKEDAGNGHKLMVASRVDDDRPQLPSYTRQVWNYANYKLRDYAAGQRITLATVAEARYDECLMCPKRTAAIGVDGRTFPRCSDCGCFLHKIPQQRGLAGAIVPEGPGKVWKASEGCPIGKWLPETDESRLEPAEATATPPDAKPSWLGRLFGKK